MHPDKKPSRSAYTIAISGILIALGWIFVILSGVLPTGRLFLLLLTSLVVATAFFEMNISGAVLVALGISVLSLTYPGLIHATVFAVFAAPLSLLILHLHHRGLPKFLQYLLTHMVMSLLLLAVIKISGLDTFIMKRLSMETWLIWLIVIALFQLVLIIYRQVLLNYELFFYERIKPWIRKRK